MYNIFMMRSLIISHVCIDENQSERSKYRAVGGPGVFIDRILKKLGSENTTIVSNYGDDYAQYLKGSKIYPTHPTSKKTLTYKNISYGDLRTQKAINRKESMSVSLTLDLSNLLLDSNVIIIAPILPNYSSAYIKSMLEEVSQDAVVVLAPQGYFRDFNKSNEVVERSFHEASEILPLIDFVIISENDHSDAKNLAKEWAETYDTTVILTLGSGGSEIITKEEVMSVKITPVPESEIVDSVGSGDIFLAAFIHKYVKCKNVINSVEYANSIAKKMLFYSSEEIQKLSFKL